MFYKNKKAELISGHEEVLTRWIAYFSDLLNEEDKN